MGAYKALRLWRRKRQPNMARTQKQPNTARAQKLNSKLIELEREIRAMLRPMRDHRKAAANKGNAIARFFKGVDKNDGNQTRAMAASGSNLNPIAAHTVSRAGEPEIATQEKPKAKRQAPGRASALGAFLSICFGLLAICGTIIALLFLQIKDMKVEMTGIKQRLAATEAHLGRFEKTAQQQLVKESNIFDGPPRRIPIELGNDDMKAIRASIRVLPSKPGAAQQKTRVGDKISDARSAPVPESLVTQMPKLRGAKFFVDQNGAIIIIGEGSNRVDAVIEPQ
jgi:hypothetical protein